MFNYMINLKSKSRKISASKSIDNTLFFITSKNKDNIDLTDRKMFDSKRKMIFKNKSSLISKYLGFFKITGF